MKPLRANIETLLFGFGFRKCNKQEIDFLEIDTDEYLVLRYFSKGVIADLYHEKYFKGKDPCKDEPSWNKLIKRDFSKDESDIQFVREFISNKSSIKPEKQ